MVRDGYIYGLSLLAVAAVLVWATGTWYWSIVPVLLAAFFLWFFRDPQRAIPKGEGLIVSPADGVVTETARIDTPKGPRQRISIFLNVFDVHVNRTPIAGEITAVRYQTGKFLNAMNQECAERNEQNIVTVRGEGIEIVFKQIAGLIARRIVFNYREGDRVERGQRVGLIKFGSRTDVILPAEADIRVKTGQRVKGGSSIIAEMAESETMAGVREPRKQARASVKPEIEDGEGA
ncbi:phosphatidylserine decarboxylase family protein [Occallatibacter savannae]|uniref:phosphatidylserine decarboxylase family protein n=1 Tax=Occallatibacter savannae TaxID=1002691 RepID=UPI000D69389A|nr:phosphatidylserine decarboxylase family protein [Occallatibacter savannae]